MASPERLQHDAPITELASRKGIALTIKITAYDKPRPNGSDSMNFGPTPYNDWDEVLKDVARRIEDLRQESAQRKQP